VNKDRFVSPRKISAIAVFLMAVLVAFVGVLPSAFAVDDTTAIQHVMKGTWEKPGAPLRVEPIVVVGDHAIAGWVQADMGGRALLRRKAGAWMVVLCSGDALKSADELKKAAVPADQAVTLAKSLADAESRLDPALLTQFAKFEGLVMMDQSGHHPPHHR
jgi:hypothetical protein